MASLIFKLLAIYFLFLSASYGISSLPQFHTKQDVLNVRYFSSDGKFTYYQRRSGELLLSTNYNVTPILTGEKDDIFYVQASNSKAKILVSHIKNGLYQINPFKVRSFYLGNFGDQTQLTKMADGLDAKLHLNDQWLSIYRSDSNEINFFKTNSPELLFKIKLTMGMNPYFIPQVLMATPSLIFFTDLNTRGRVGVMRFQRSENKIENLFTAADAREKFEICLSQETFYSLETGIEDFSRGSIISKMPIEAVDFGKREILYESKFNDLGNFICDFNKTHIYFVKRTGAKTTEAAKLNITEKKVEILSDLKYVGQIIALDKTLLIPYRGLFYLLEGQGITQMDKLK